MKLKRVVLREQANRDVEEAIDYYVREAGVEIALGFVDALEETYRLIAEHPGIGSQRYAHELDLPGLRHRSISRFPWIVFYVELEANIDIWRVLDARRDIPAWLAQPET